MSSWFCTSISRLAEGTRSPALRRRLPALSLLYCYSAPDLTPLSSLQNGVVSIVMHQKSIPFMCRITPSVGRLLAVQFAFTKYNMASLAADCSSLTGLQISYPLSSGRKIVFAHRFCFCSICSKADRSPPSKCSAPRSTSGTLVLSVSL